MQERSSRGFDRRTVLKVGGMLGVSGALAGCVEGINPLSEDESGPETTNRSGVVPDFAQGIAHGNLEALLADSALRDGLNQQIQTLDEQTDGYSGPMSVDSFLDQMEDNAGVDPRKIHEVVGFWGSDAETGAAVLWTDWSESALTNQMSSYSEETYHGTTLYVPEYGGPGAVLGDGVYAVGSSEAVRSVIDVRDGRAKGLSGRLRSEYDATQGMTRVAVDVPDLSMERLTGEEASSGSQVEQTANSLLKTVEYASGSFFQDGNSRVMQVSLATESADDAEALDGSLSAGRQLALNQLGTMRNQSEPSSMERLLLDRVGTFARDATISQNGSSVDVRYAAPPAEFVRNSPALLLAAGVLFNTAGFLQTRAEETGQESSQQAGRIQPMSTVGEVVDGEVAVVKMTVRKAPVTADISLRDAVVQAVSPTGVVTLTTNGGTGENFLVKPVKDDDGSIAASGVLNSDEDVATLVFDIGGNNVSSVDSSGIGALPAGADAYFTLTTQAGAQTELKATVPDSLAGKNVVRL